MTVLPANVVMKTLLAEENGMTRETLARNIKENFGSDFIFEKCSGDRLPLDGVLNFMLGKNKLLQVGNLIKVNPLRTEGHC